MLRLMLLCLRARARSRTWAPAGASKMSVLTSAAAILLCAVPFPKEAPQVWIDPHEQTLVLSLPLSTSAAQTEIKNDAALTKRLTSMKEKEGDYFLQVLDARTGMAIGRLLIETGRGSFRISRAFAAGDWVVVFDTKNRILLYSLSSGEQKGTLFGNKAAINPISKLLSVENESGKLTVYSLDTMEKRDQFTFSSPVSLARFTPDGKTIFVLTASQIVYLLDVSSTAR